MIADRRLARRRGGLAIQIDHGLLAICLIGCSSSPEPSAAAKQRPPNALGSPPTVRVIETWFDATAVAELAAAWDVFDNAEQDAIARHEAALGKFADTLSMPADDFARQVAGRIEREPHDAAWLQDRDGGTHRRGLRACGLSNTRASVAERASLPLPTHRRPRRHQ